MMMVYRYERSQVRKGHENEEGKVVRRKEINKNNLESMSVG